MAMMGQNMGAGNKDRAKESFSKALKYGFWGATAIGILVALFANLVIGVFTTDPTVMAYARSYMWTVALTYGFLAALMIEASAFQAIGKSWHGFWIFILRVGEIRETRTAVKPDNQNENQKTGREAGGKNKKLPAILKAKTKTEP